VSGLKDSGRSRHPPRCSYFSAACTAQTVVRPMWPAELYRFGAASSAEGFTMALGVRLVVSGLRHPAWRTNSLTCIVITLSFLWTRRT
jgi:hypothetical protein